jgi:hypothetical protein
MNDIRSGGQARHGSTEMMVIWVFFNPINMRGFLTEKFLFIYHSKSLYLAKDYLYEYSGKKAGFD